MLLFYAVIALLALFGVVALIYYYIYKRAGTNDVLPDMTPLHAKKEIYSANDTQQTLLGSAGSTVMGYVKLLPGDRTQTYSEEYVPVAYVENNWYLEMIPSPTDLKPTATRLRIQTRASDQTVKSEMIPLPSIPKQKWMFVAILREGRRFDVIYNNELVASKRLANYPTVVSSPLVIGGQGLAGSAIHWMVNGTRLTPSEVERERIKHVDTNQVILEDHPINVYLPNLSTISQYFKGINLFAQCPPGLPCDPVTKPPQDNLLRWGSPYA